MEEEQKMGNYENEKENSSFKGLQVVEKWFEGWETVRTTENKPGE